MIQRRRKISPTYHERLIWGQGDGSGLCAVDSKVGRIGQLACWEHYNPLARYALMADGEQIHSAMYPGSIFGELFSEQTQVSIRQHALESGCFVVCATAWLNADQQAQIAKDTGGNAGPIAGGCFTAIVAPDGTLLGDPIRSGEGVVIADLDFKILRLVVGNPLIMREMAKIVPDAASYAPVTILVDERADGVHLSYDSMASLIAPYGSQAALAVALDLDAKIESLLKTAAR